MADNSTNGGQPTLEKLASEGIRLQKCIASEGLPGYGASAGAKPADGSKPKGVLSSMPRKGGGGY
jgi:hypothetical protein